MKYRYIVIIFILAFFLQTAVFGMFPVMGVSPNLILCAAVVITFTCVQNNGGITAGLIAGLLYDVCFLQYMGVTALALGITLAAVAVVREYILNRENLMSMVIVSAGSVIAYYTIFWLIYRIAGIEYSYLAVLKYMPLYLVINMVVMLLMYGIIIRKVVRHKADRYSVWGGF